MKKQYTLILFLFYTLFNSQAQSAGFNSAFAILNINGAGNSFYCLEAVNAPFTCGGNPNFNGANLGLIAGDTGSLVLNGVEVNNFRCGGATFNEVFFHYRVYPTGTPSGAFIDRDLFFNFFNPNGCGGNNEQWTKFADNQNLLAGITAPGNYTIELYVRQNVSAPIGNQFLNNGGTNYRATFDYICSTAPLNGTYNIPSTCFPTMAFAVNFLNTYGVSGPVTFNVASGYTETAPSGGFLITGTGTAANPVVFRKNGVGLNPTFTASPSQTVGRLFDGIFRFVGADFITLDGFTLQENSANTVATAATNNMTEFGVGFFYSNTTNGAQNNTIRNCTISLNRIYQNTFGIYSNSIHTATNITTSATATGSLGGNSGLTIQSNAISNVNQGIVIVGPSGAADFNENITIGGSSTTGNTITNYGTTGAISGYNSVSGTVNGILVRNSRNVTISHNTITSSTGIISGQSRGIFIPTGNTTATGAFTTTISNNIISCQSAVDAAITGIFVETGSHSALASLIISNNSFGTFGHSVASGSAITFISNTSPALNVSINNNIFGNNTLNTTGNLIFINNTYIRPNGTVINCNNNSITGNISKTGIGSSVVFYNSTLASPSITGVENVNNNTISNITISGLTTFSGFLNTVGDSIQKICQNNTFQNLTLGSGAVTILSVGNSPNGIISGNTIRTISTDGSFSGITVGSGNMEVVGNIIHTITSSNLSLAGIIISGGGGSTHLLHRNKIYNLSTSNTNPLLSGIAITGGGNVSVYNNVVGDLRAPSANALDAIRGISFPSGTLLTSYFVAHNTVFLNASSTGANFGTSGIFHLANATATTANLTLRNNLIVNTSTANGTGRTVAFRRSATLIDNYNTASNNNAFYAGVPSSLNLIYFNGLPYQTLATFKAVVGTRESNSVTENVVFASTNGADANYLSLPSNSTVSELESGGVLVNTPITINQDHLLQVRPGGVGITNGGGQNVDIGAYEFDRRPYDRTPPTITYTPLIEDCELPSFTLDNVSITEIHDNAIGLQTTGINAPRLYFRQGASPWTSVLGTLTSGDGFNGLWSFTMTGLTTGNIQYYVIAQDLNGNLISNPSAGLVALSTSNVITHPTTPNELIFAVATWNGTTWTPTTPSATTRVVFNGNYSSSGNIEACSVFVNSGTITFNSGHSLLVENGVTVSGGNLIFEDSASLVQNNDASINSGPITVKRNSTPMIRFDYTYWSSPVENWALNQLSPNTRFDKYLSFNPASGWITHLNGTSIMEKGKGYAVRVPDIAPYLTVRTIYPAQFVGVPHNGESQINVTTGVSTLNLIGNPYPSAVDIDLFLLYPPNDTVLGGTIYLWTHNTSPSTSFPGSNTFNYTFDDYALYNLTGGTAAAPSSLTGGLNNNIPTGKIASGQGFFIEATQAGTARFFNYMRENSNNNQFFRTTLSTQSGVVEKNRFWLNLQHENGFYKQVLVGYLEGATSGFDRLYDGKSVTATNFANLYINHPSFPLSIEGRGLPFLNTDTISLGFMAAQSGEFTISLENFEGLFENQDIFIEDKLLQTITNLKETPYTFYTENGTFNTRFEILFSNQTLSVNPIESVVNQVYLLHQENDIKVVSKNELIKEIIVYDLLGRKIMHNQNISENNFNYNKTSLPIQSLLFKVILKNNKVITLKGINTN